MSEPGDGQPGGELSREQQATLLRVAREAIAAHLARREWELPSQAPAGALGEPRGAFVTLRRRADEELRGCIGRMVSDRPLLETVARMAVSAATEDPRFEAVSAGELPGLRVEISALGALQPLRPEDVEVGRHGLVVSALGRRGVLLPQVAAEHGWDRETFLSQTCRKAGLPADAWRSAECEILGFTATVFADDEQVYIKE